MRGSAMNVVSLPVPLVVVSCRRSCSFPFLAWLSNACSNGVDVASSMWASDSLKERTPLLWTYLLLSFDSTALLFSTNRKSMDAAAVL